jgi:hypothetical protein
LTIFNLLSLMVWTLSDPMLYLHLQAFSHVHYIINIFTARFASLWDLLSSLNLLSLYLPPLHFMRSSTIFKLSLSILFLFRLFYSQWYLCRWVYVTCSYCPHWRFKVRMVINRIWLKRTKASLEINFFPQHEILIFLTIEIYFILVGALRNLSNLQHIYL